MRCSLVLFFTLALPCLVAGQSREVSTDDIVELSPFTVTAANDTGFQAASSLAGGRIATPIVDPSGMPRNPNVAISILKKADAVAIQFVLSHTGDKQESRNQELYASVT